MELGDEIEIGFSYDGVIMDGISRKGGPIPLGQFILPSGIVLNDRNPYFVPVLGFMDSIGVEQDRDRERWFHFILFYASARLFFPFVRIIAQLLSREVNRDFLWEKSIGRIWRFYSFTLCSKRRKKMH